MHEKHYDGEFLDITAPKWVHVEVDKARNVLYVHVDGVTRMRICNIQDGINVTGYEAAALQPLTLEQAKKLPLGTILYSGVWRNADGTPQRWKVNGAIRVWKTRPECVNIPVKHGLREYGNITQNELPLFFLEEDQAKLALKISGLAK